jgi:hypothetical protein
MLSRGYTGEPLAEEIPALSKTDWAISSLSTLVLILIFFIGILTGR